MWWIILILLLLIFAPGLLLDAFLGIISLLQEVFDPEFVSLIMVVGGLVLALFFLQFLGAVLEGEKRKNERKRKMKAKKEAEEAEAKKFDPGSETKPF